MKNPQPNSINDLLPASEADIKQRLAAVNSEAALLRGLLRLKRKQERHRLALSQQAGGARHAS
jgi:hypothetical protein